MAEGIAAGYDADGKLVGIEILDAIGRIGDKRTLRQVMIEGLGPAKRLSVIYPGCREGSRPLPMRSDS